MKNKNRYLAYFILFSSIFIGLFFNISFYSQSQLGLFYPLFWIICITLFEVAKFLSLEKISFRPKELLFITVIIPSLAVLINEDSSLNRWIVLFNIASFFIVALYVSWNEKILDFSFINNFILWINHFFGQFIGLQNFFDSLVFTLNKNNSDRVTSYLPKIFLGLFIAIPFLCFYFLLFSASDQLFLEIFNELGLKNLERIFSDDAFGILIIWTVLGFISLMFLIGAFFYKREKTETKDASFIDPLVVNVFMFLINSLFFVYIISQFIYLFGDKSVVIDLGIVYSEYAKKGFNEMMVIAIFTLGLVYAIKSFTLKENIIFNSLLNLFLSINIGFNFVIILSAFTRLNLYVDGYGLSTTRFYVYVTLIFLSLVFLIYLGIIGFETYELFATKNRSKNLLNIFSLIIFCLINLTLAFTGFINPHGFVANYNIERLDEFDTNSPTASQFDIYYLSRLSPSGYSKLVLDKDTEKLLSNDQICSLAFSWIYDRKSQSLTGFKLSRFVYEHDLDDYFEDKGILTLEGYSNQCSYRY